MFGYRILGFGSGGAGGPPVAVDYLVVAGGGGAAEHLRWRHSPREFLVRTSARPAPERGPARARLIK